MTRRVAHFSCGAASAIATAIGNPDVVIYCETGGEHPDNQRFAAECEAAFGFTITRLRSDKYASTWEVWEGEKFLSGLYGAPCTRALKVKPSHKFMRDTDTNIWGYTADKRDQQRAEQLLTYLPNSEFPLIEKGITKEGCLELLMRKGIEPPLTYAQGFEHANCIPCPKATSPAYWALVRHRYPEQFNRLADLDDRFGANILRLNNKRVPLKMLPPDAPMRDPIQPQCDLFCQLLDKELA